MRNRQPLAQTYYHGSMAMLLLLFPVLRGCIEQLQTPMYRQPAAVGDLSRLRIAPVLICEPAQDLHIAPTVL